LPDSKHPAIRNARTIAGFLVAGSPPIATAKEKAMATQMLNNMRQINLGLGSLRADGRAKFASAAQVKEMLIENKIFSAADLERLQFDKISIGNVSEGDPPDTIFLQAKSGNGRSTTVILISGDGALVRTGRSFGRPPPRTPAFLE
jgi:hypothetical protein